MIVYAVVDAALSPDFPLGDPHDVFVRREDAELVIVSKVVPGGSRDDAEYLEIFWPE